MVGVRQYKEDVLHDAQEVLLEEGNSNSRVSVGEIDYNLQTH